MSRFDTELSLGPETPEADAVEQSIPADQSDLADDSDVIGGPLSPDDNASEADVLEQREIVPVGDEDDPAQGP